MPLIGPRPNPEFSREVIDYAFLKFLEESAVHWVDS